MTESQTPDAGRQTAEARPQRPDTLRSFWLMFVVEFQNAFSDNVLRWLVTFLIVGMGLSLEKRDSLVPLVGAVFALPFVLFSMAGGFFADRYSKRSVAIAVKCAELGIMSVASLGLWLDNIPLMLTGIFLMSTHSAIFGPTKYGMLPELLPEKKLSWGNGIFGLGTFSAAITGTIFAGMLSDAFGQRQIFSGAILIALALVGLFLCLGVRRLPAADPEKKFRANFLGDFLSQFKAIRRDRILFLGVVGNTFLSFLAMLLQLTVVFYGKDIFHFDDRHSGYLQGGMLVGVGAGSLAAGFLSGGKIEYGLIPLGMAGLTDFFRAALPRRFRRRRFRVGPRPARLLRRLLQRARQRHHSTPPRRWQQRQGHRHRGLAELGRHFARFGRLLSAYGSVAPEAASNFSLWRGAVTGRNRLLRQADAGFAVAVCTLVRHPFALPHPRFGA